MKRKCRHHIAMWHSSARGDKLVGTWKGYILRLDLKKFMEDVCVIRAEVFALVRNVSTSVRYVGWLVNKVLKVMSPTLKLILDSIGSQ